MKINRNGMEIELTWQEIREAYEIMDLEYFKEDVICRAEEMSKKLSEEDVNRIAAVAKRDIEHNDSYWESYWMTIEYAIENC
jgi:hypothetical protein